MDKPVLVKVKNGEIGKINGKIGTGSAGVDKSKTRNCRENSPGVCNRPRDGHETGSSSGSNSASARLSDTFDRQTVNGHRHQKHTRGKIKQ